MQKPKPKTIINVLSLDGGGIRGLIPLRFLHALEYATGKKTHDIFHTMVGTSTGGLITALLSLPSQVSEDKGPVSAKKALEIYQGLGPEIFPKVLFNFKHYAVFLLLSLIAAGYIWIQARLLRLELPPGEQTHSKLLELYPWMWILLVVFLLCLNLAAFFGKKIKECISTAKYSGGRVVRFCRGHFVEGTKLKDAKTTVGICATDIKKRRSFVFNSMRSQIYHNCALHGAEIAQIARATSAAPTYFNPEFFVIVPNEGKEVKPHHKKESDLKPEMTPWDSRDPETVYDRKTVAFEDGGTKMNNPSKAAIKLAQMQLKQTVDNPDDYEIRLLSVGTGSKKGKQEDPTLTYHTGLLHKLSKIGFLKFLDNLTHENWKAGIWGVFQRRLMGDVFEVLINAHNDHLEVEQHFKESNMENNYMRQQFKITEKQLDGMDDTSKENMESLVKSANRMILNKKRRGEWSDDFKKCVEFLGLPIVNQPDSEWEMKEDDFEDESDSECEAETETKKNK